MDIDITIILMTILLELKDMINIYTVYIYMYIFMIYNTYQNLIVHKFQFV